MEDLTKNNFKPIGIFLAITLGLSAIYYFLIIYSGSLSSGWGQFTMGLMWCPGISALITMKILKRNISDLLVAYLVIWVFGWGGFYDKEFVVRLTNSFGFGEIGSGLIIACYFIIFGIFGTIRGTASALGEEIGWRGFLVPELFKTQGFTKTSLISGFIWGVWHLPILLFADYNSGTPSWYAMSCFMVLIISMSFIYTWFRIKSGSLWTAVLLHASHNLFIQQIFTPLTEDTGNTAYYIDEFGIVLPIVGIGFAIYYWSKRKELKPATNNA
jgi:membrane protease YdiL (CAAX protease family)